MAKSLSQGPQRNTSRREFLTTSAAMAGTAVAGSLAIGRAAYAAGNDVIKIGLIGCGGRGSGAAVNAMNAGEDVRLVAMGDIFEDRLQFSRERIQKMKPEQATIDDDHCFVGFDACQKVIDSGIDVLLIAATSHFHPVMFKAAVDADKHVFCEKPHGLDVPGLQISMAACEEARKKNLCVVSGLCWRYDVAVRETMKRIQDGAIGEIIAIQENYLTAPYICRARKPEWNEFEYQIQNWYHFNWLSGDQTSQQLIHSIDKASWALGDVPPVKAFGLGGRQVCLDPIYGDQFDHHSVAYEYENGVRVFAHCRDIPNCHNTTSDLVLGTKGRAIMPVRCRIEGENEWRFEGKKPSMYDNEHKELFDAIRSGKTINNGDYMNTSTMLGILAQMVCYTGKEITWEQAMQSKLDFSLERYDWDAEAPIKPDADGRYATAMPGINEFA